MYEAVLNVALLRRPDDPGRRPSVVQGDPEIATSADLDRRRCSAFRGWASGIRTIEEKLTLRNHFNGVQNSNW
jgi:hypothetical protein